MYKSTNAFSNLYGDYKMLGYILNHTHHFPFLDYQITKFRYLKLPTFRYLNHQIRYERDQLST